MQPRVPIHLGTDDINREIEKLKIPSVTKAMDVVLEEKQGSEITTTIITNCDGTVVSTTSEPAECTGPQTSSSLPSLPKITTISPDNSPGSPQGNFQLRSYKWKKKGTKSRKYTCQSCNAVKDSVQELNEHQK